MITDWKTRVVCSGTRLARAAFLLVLVACTLCGRSQAEEHSERLFILPYESGLAMDELIAAMRGGRKRIDIAIYSFTNMDIARAIRDAQSEGTKVRIIYDKQNSKEARSTIGYLEKFQNVTTCTLEGLPGPSRNGSMHQKMMLVDDILVVLGSANWSVSGFQGNYETMLFSSSPKIIAHAQSYYDDMFKRCAKF